jgi:cytochrome c peroxidase
MLKVTIMVRAIVLCSIAMMACREALAAPPVSPVHLVGHEEAELLLRIQDVIDDWDPRKLANPLVETSVSSNTDGERDVRKNLRRPDLEEFIADVAAAEALGKAFFWEMQAGSDFRRVEDGTANGNLVGTSCGSCHYRNGADARDRYTTRMPYVVWDQYVLAPGKPLGFGESQLPFDAKQEATRSIVAADHEPAGKFSLIVASQGVQPEVFTKLNPDKQQGAGWVSELSTNRKIEGYPYKPAWSMFIENRVDDKPGFRGRQITERNSPTTINSVFSDRLFHDGRAESTFNGFSIFGDKDKREVIHRSKQSQFVDADGKLQIRREIIPVHVAITNAALASQAVGPIVNDVEMSYLGRTFPNLACKLLDAPVLGYQDVDEHDSVFSPLDASLVREQRGKPGFNGEENGPNLKRLVGAKGRATFTYRELIQRAFRREWWDGGDQKVELVLLRQCDQDGHPVGSLMEANFSLYWGLSIMLYEASLVSNQSPFDHMMEGKPELVENRWSAVKGQLGRIFLDRYPNFNAPEHTSGAAVFQHGFRVFMNQGCIECHGGPLFSEIYDRVPAEEELAIQYKMDRVLLPNSKSDSIALKRQDLRSRMLVNVANELATHKPEWAPQAKKLSGELDLLRETARGNRGVLVEQVDVFLDRLAAPVDYPNASVSTIAELLIDFEKGAASHFGNRLFFTEDERVALAEQITEPVLVEKMPIPPKQVASRPRLPISGPLASDPYAFYDLGFYNLGVAPPRFDQGIGESQVDNLTIEEAVMTVAARYVEGPDEGLRAKGKALLEAARQGEDLPNLNEDRALREAVNDVRKQSAAFRQAVAGGRGTAYRFRQEWSRERRESPRVRDRKNNAVVPMPPQADVETPRTCHEGPKCDLDEADRSGPAPPDTSWDRPAISETQRRSSHMFESRARALVTDEEPWGFRKPFLHDNELAFWGAFRTPSLRNVELTAPYMHNGRFMTLLDVVEFYEHEDLDGLRFIPRDPLLNPDKHPELVPLHFKPSDKRALVFFLMCLTDERVRREEAPFDHPSLELVNGYEDQGAGLIERVVHIPKSGRGGQPKTVSLGLFPSER